MGVMLHLGFQNKTATGTTGMPSPVDSATPDAEWPWQLWFGYLSVFARFGGTVAVTPPMTKGASLGTGYDPYNHYDLGSNPHGPAGRRETRYGSVEDMMRLSSAVHALGMEMYVNVVHHHMDGDSGNYRYDYIAGDGVSAGRFPKDSHCFWIWSGEQQQNPDTVFDPSTDWSFGREFRWLSGTYGDGAGSNGQGYVLRGLQDSLDWQTRRLDVDGYFPDDGKGSNVKALKETYEYGAMSDKFAFAEVSDGTTAHVLNFIGQTGDRLGALDFPLRYKIRNICNWSNSFEIILQEGVIWHNPESAVTFVENIDLDCSDPITIRKELAYALILGLPGYPMVFGKDIYTRADGGYGLLDPILNMIWCHETFAKGDTVVRAIGDHYLVIERMGDDTTSGAIFAYSIADTWLHVPVQTKWGNNTHLHDYQGQAIDKWTQGNTLDLYIPPDQSGQGRGHCCYAVANVDNPIRPAPLTTTQELFGAADLDMPTLKSGVNVLTEIWADPAHPVKVGIVADYTGWMPNTVVDVTVTDANAKVVGMSPLSERGILSFTLPTNGTAFANPLNITATGANLPAGGSSFQGTLTYTGVAPTMRHVPS